jgi:hypothetical protein
MKFKPGQKVRIRSLKSLENDPLITSHDSNSYFLHAHGQDAITRGMIIHLDKIVTIDRVFSLTNSFSIEGDSPTYSWYEWMVADPLIDMLKQCLDEE